MAKRKGARTSSRKRTVARSGRAAAAGRKRVAKKKSAAGRRTAAAVAKKKTAAKRSARATSAARAAKPRKKSALVARRKPAAARRRPVAAKTAARRAKTARTAKRKSPVRRQTPAAVKKTPVVARKAPALERSRRTISDDDMVPMPPSTLDLDRSASSARSGRRGLRDRFDQHTETSPALTGDDVDADWESAYSVGDEAPGGDSPTPDQDIVDDIGRAVGVEYQDNEELKGDEKIADRDRHRWELDPASAEDYDEH